MIEFDEYKQKLELLRPSFADLSEALALDAAKARVDELESAAAAEDFWSDLENSQKVLTETKRLKNKIEKYENLHRRFADLCDLLDIAILENEESMLSEIVSEYDSVSGELSELSLITLLSGEYDGNNAILSYHAGAGGTEAQDWAEMLYRMHTRWAEKHGFKFKVLDYLDGEGAGMKSATVLIEGDNAFGLLKSEMGVHRLVRISPFDSSGRRHTSFSSVEVMPEISDDIKIEISPDDLKVDTYRSGGAGGQHVNKTESAIRITHLPTGIVCACQNERSQHQNREVAMRMLKSKLVEIKEREHLDKIEDIKGTQKDIAWGSQIRSYVFMPYTLAKDHRTGFENGNINAVMDGDLDGFINAYLKDLSKSK